MLVRKGSRRGYLEVAYLGLHFLLHLEWFRHIQSLLNGWSVVDTIRPCVKKFEFFYVHPGPNIPIDPGKACEIRYSHLIPN